MTKRVEAFLVVLDEATREDDAEELKNAILQFQNVAGVRDATDDEPVEVAIAKTRLRGEIFNKMVEFLKEW